ncbi:MAG: FecR domain-containing protein [Pseudomonadota bacterium]
MTSEPDIERLHDEAAEIFLRLRDTPDDAETLSRRDAFLAQGETAQDVYRRVQIIWAGSGKPKKSKTIPSIVAAALLTLGAYFAFEPVRIFATADIITRLEPAETQLASGDIVVLDAGSALVDLTETGARESRLLKGAAFFDVEQDDRRFTVQLEEVSATTLGTSFDAVILEDGVSVGVSDGAVLVESGAQSWRVEAGQTLFLRDDNPAQISQIQTEDVAAWREDRLIVDRMRFAEAVSIIERRLRGNIVILNDDLADVLVSGGLNLSDPASALRALVLGQGATLSGSPGVFAVITK